MPEYFTGPDGRDWELIDFRMVPPGDRKKRLALGDAAADGRAFHRPDDTRIYWFGRVAYRDTSLRTLGDQFKSAKPTTATPARQHWDRAGDPGA